MKNCNCGGRPILESAERYFDLKIYYRYVCAKCGKHTTPCDNMHDAFKEWEALNPDIPRVEKIEMPILSPEEIKEGREFNERILHPRKRMSEAQRIINDLRSAAEWLKEHGRNTNTALIGICERAADYLEKHTEREDGE